MDGTKIQASASMAANRNESGLKKEIKKYFKEADRQTPGKVRQEKAWAQTQKL
ncbi:hypothetical protein MASR1M66_07470 [Aminivibrio sp.]